MIPEIDSRLTRSLALIGITKPTLIQQVSIPLALKGKDIVARAKTGSGKTIAYCIPVLQKILSSDLNSTRALILVPSRELASQVTLVLTNLIKYCSHLKLFNACDSNGLLQSETPDIIISTPSSIVSICQVQNISFKDTLESLVIDEADLILDFGYEEDLNKLLTFMPKVFQSFLFSATLTCDVDRLKVLLVRNPAIIKLQDLDQQEMLTQYSIECTDQEKFLLTYFFLKLKVHPFGTGKTIIFVNDIDRGYKLKLFLEQFNIKSCVLNSQLPFTSRHHIVTEFNRGLYDYLIATDEINKEKQPDLKRKSNDFGVARGIDFVNVLAVINFDLPDNLKGYLHRVGRTARGLGNKGFALSFVSTNEVKPAKKTQKEIFEKIKKKQESRLSRSIIPFDIDMTHVNAFRYRIEDAMRIVTKQSIKEAKVKQIKKEILASDKLTSHFKENPQDLEALRHDKVIFPTKILSHMKHVPSYLLPNSKKSALVGGVESEMGKVNFDPTRQVKRFKKRAGKEKSLDPLKEFAM